MYPKHRLTILLFLLPTLLFAQSGMDRIRAEIIETRNTFLKNNVYIISTDNATMDTALAIAIRNNWTATAIKGMITSKELKTLIRDKNNSFITLREWNGVTFASTERNVILLSGIFCFNGGKKNIDKYSTVIGTDIVAFDMADFGGYEGDLKKCIFRLDLMVGVIDSKVRQVPVNDSARNLYQTKTLLVNENHFSKSKDRRFEDNAFSNYPYKYKIASEAEITEAIRSRDERYQLIVPILNGLMRGFCIFDIAPRLLTHTGKTTARGLKKPWLSGAEIIQSLRTATDYPVKKVFAEYSLSSITDWRLIGLESRIKKLASLTFSFSINKFSKYFCVI